MQPTERSTYATKGIAPMKDKSRQPFTVAGSQQQALSRPFIGHRKGCWPEAGTVEWRTRAQLPPLMNQQTRTRLARALCVATCGKPHQCSATNCCQTPCQIAKCRPVGAGNSALEATYTEYRLHRKVRLSHLGDAERLLRMQHTRHQPGSFVSLTADRVAGIAQQ